MAVSKSISETRVVEMPVLVHVASQAIANHVGGLNSVQKINIPLNLPIIQIIILHFSTPLFKRKLPIILKKS